MMDIVEELRRDRESGAKRLVCEYKAGLMSIARRFFANESDAEELVNATFAKAVDNIDGYLEKSAFFAWLCQILNNEFRNSVKRKSNRNEICPGDVPELEDESARDEIYENLDATLLRTAIAELNPEQREVIVLRYFEDLPIEKIAKFLTLPAGTVRSRLFYARKALAARLGAGVKEAVKKPGVKAVLVALALCGLTALGAAVWNLGGREAAETVWTSGTGGTSEGTGATGATGGTGATGATGEGTGATGATGTTSASPASPASPARPAGPFVPFVPSVPDLSTPSAQENQNMNATTLRTFAASAALAAATGAANTLTWTGGSSGLLSSSANWDTGTSPQSGDTCVFPAAVILEHEDFDLGTAGLIFVNDEVIENHVSFSGNGGIVKNGNGDFVIFEDTQGTFTGDAVFNGGQLVLTASKNRQPVSFGAGKMVFTEAETSKPFLYENTFGLTFPNAIELRGHSSGNALQMTQAITLSGDIASAHDFTINIGYQALAVSGNVHAPGKTLTASYTGTGGNAANSPTTYSGMIDASFVKTGNGNASRANIYLSGRSEFLSNSLTVLAGTNVITSSGYWGGTNVVVNGNSAVLRLEGAQNLSQLANVELVNGGKLDLSSGCAVRVMGLFVGDSWQEDGTYTAMDFPGAIYGTGSITVSSIAADAIWCGGAAGLWSVGDNWSDGAVSDSGAIVLFTNAVELAQESVDFGKNGVTIFSDFDITSHIWFTGTGWFVKKGSGRFILRGDAGGDFAGGAVFEDGVLSLNNRNYSGNDRNGYRFFGSGEVALVSSGSCRPYIDFDEWDSGLTNKISILGANIGGNRQGALYAHQPVNTLGPIVADNDFKVFESYYTLNLFAIDAPGHTVFVDSYKAATVASVEIVLNGTINANVTKSARPEPLTLNGSSPSPDNVLTLFGGTNTLTSTAYWGGNVVVSGIHTQLALCDDGNLSKDATLSISTDGGATIDIASGVKVKTGEFWVNGSKKDPGIYTAANLPGVVTGAGRLVVGTAGTMIVFK